MTKRFLAMIPFLWEWEGRVFENDPDDPGNYVNGKLVGTKYGIDARSHPNVDIKNITEDEAAAIYATEYWDANRCEKMPYPLGEAYFDTCVNCGPGRAAKLLKISRDTAGFLDARDAFYERLAANRPRSKKYLRGWKNRVSALRKHLGIK